MTRMLGFFADELGFFFADELAMHFSDDGGAQ
jgi:hypothetical protein